MKWIILSPHVSCDPCAAGRIGPQFMCQGTDLGSGRHVRVLMNDACCVLLQGPVRDAVAAVGAGVADIAESDLRPVILRDFQVDFKQKLVL